MTSPNPAHHWSHWLNPTERADLDLIETELGEMSERGLVLRGRRAQLQSRASKRRQANKPRFAALAADEDVRA